MTSEHAFRYWLFALGLCAAATGLCIVFVDRQLAAYLEAHVRHTEFWFWLDLSLRPWVLAVALALFFLLGCGAWLIAGHRLRPWTEIPFLCSWATLWAVASEIIGKRILGRGGPDPIFVHNHLYGFHFLHGQPQWDSFPSGTAAVSTAIVAVLWVVKPRWRWGGCLIANLLIAAVVIGNYHWLSDVIAGAFLGASIGWATVRLLRPFNRFTVER